MPASTPTRAPGHVLVVDDTPESRRLAELQLTAIGWVAVGVDSGEAALGYLAQHLPDAVLCDIRMPKMSGEELAQRIRGLHGDSVKLVAYTAHAMETELRAIRAAGFDAVLTKPAEMEELERVLPVA